MGASKINDFSEVSGISASSENICDTNLQLYEDRLRLLVNNIEVEITAFLNV